MFPRTPGKPYTETFRFSATPVVSGKPAGSCMVNNRWQQTLLVTVLCFVLYICPSHTTTGRRIPGFQTMWVFPSSPVFTLLWC